MNSLSNKITICHILNLITGRADGVYTHLKMLLNLLPKDKYRQIVIFQGGQTVHDKLTKMGIKTFIVPSLSNKNKNIFRSIYEVRRILINENVDIIHTHFIKSYIIFGLINLFLKKKHIFNYHGIFIDNIYYLQYEKIILNLVHFFICKTKCVDIAVVPSYFSKSILQKETSLFPRIEVYFNGYSASDSIFVDQNITSELEKLKKDYFTVGIIARMNIEKRIDLSLKTLALLRYSSQKVFFVFMGDGLLEKEMIMLSKYLRVFDNCRFFGYVNDASYYIKYFDCILFSSDSEGLPLTIWEAMANSVPVIASNVGGNKEIIENERCGFIFERGDIKRASEFINYLILNPEVKHELGENGKIALLKKYSNENFISFFDELYSNLY